jgi:hypothetical protein
MSKKPRKRDETKRLLSDIRKCDKYMDWREEVLRVQIPSYPRVPKNINVHHQHELIDIVRENHIKSMKDALDCDMLWDVNNGVVLTIGEHSAVTAMQRYCGNNVSVGFIHVLELFIKEKKGTARYLEG